MIVYSTNIHALDVPFFRVRYGTIWGVVGAAPPYG